MASAKTTSTRTSSTTVSDLARKRGINDLVSHIAKSDNHLWQALQSLQEQSNHLVQNVMDLSNATVALGAAQTPTVTPAVPGTGGSPGGSSSSGAGTGGTPGGGSSGGITGGIVPPGTGAEPPLLANFILLNPTSHRNPNGIISYDADVQWNNPGAPGSDFNLGGAQIWVVSTNDPNFAPPILVGAAAYNHVLGSAQGTHITQQIGPPQGGTWVVACIPINNVGQRLREPDTYPSADFTDVIQTRTWDLVPPG
jgi:hypothetical protein